MILSAGPDTYEPKIALAKPENRYHSTEWFHWCGSVIKAEDGRYYLFHSRWPKSIGFAAWLTHSEVAVASSDSPSGPWKHEYVALKPRDDGWDAITAHNPKIEKFGDTYYLYYIGTQAKLTEEQLVSTAKLAAGTKPNWAELRSNQRTGVATSKSIKGPWKRQEAPCCVPADPVKTVTVNPAVVQRPDGGYLMMIKGDKFVKPASQRIQAIALSDTPLGPFVIQPKPAISDYDTEDASVWWDKKRERYYAVFHAHTHFGLITSENGTDWQKAAHPQFSGKGFKTTDGGSFVGSRMERPAVFLGASGEPSVFISCYLTGKPDDTAILTIPLE